MMDSSTGNSTYIPPETVTEHTLTHFQFANIILNQLYTVYINYFIQQLAMSTTSNKKQHTIQQPKTKIISKQPISKKVPNKNGNKITDKRFQSAEYDPKFIAPSEKITKIKIDKRFADKLKEDKFQISGQVDKYGRKITGKEKMSDMNDYYYTQDQNQQEQETVQNNQIEKKKKQKQNNKSVKIIKNQVENEESMEEQNQQQQQENNISKWMQQYNEESSDDMNDEEQVEDSDSVWSDDDKNVIKNQNVQATKRLALCNYDWMNINAKDLMILFSSFKPASGTIISVSVYYSQIGKEKLVMEQKYGPQGIWNQKAEQKKKNQSVKEMNKLERKKKQQQQAAFDARKLRTYQKQRLKYCYAVIECNSKKTADEIYKQCDGNQFENSNLLFDLRFIPDDLKFDPSMLKQKCDQLPVAGEVKNFVNRALGHSKVELTWQDPELNHIATLKKKSWNKMTDKQLDNIDWGVYMNEQDHQANDKFNKLIGKGAKEQKVDDEQMVANVSDWRKQCNKKYKKKDQQEQLEITFPSGFDRQIQPKVYKVSLNKQLKTRKQRWQSIKNEKKSRQQIQLLVEKDTKQEFHYNPQDQRFRAVFSNPAYSIDPVNPKFDHRKAGKVFEQVVKRNKNKNLI